MTRPPAPLSSRGRPRYLQQCQQPLGPPRGAYREGRAAAPHRTLLRTVRPGLKCRLVHAPHSRFGTLVRDPKRGLKYRRGAGRFSTDGKLHWRGAGSPIAPGASGPRGPAGRAEGACRASGMIVKQNPAPVGGGGGVRWGGRGGGGGGGGARANVLGALGGAVT